MSSVDSHSRMPPGRVNPLAIGIQSKTRNRELRKTLETRDYWKTHHDRIVNCQVPFLSKRTRSEL